MMADKGEVANGPVANACYLNAVEEMDRLERAGVRDVQYVEGWAVRERAGQFEPFQHGWLEVDRQVHDVTPDNGCVKYFPVVYSRDPNRDGAERGIRIPFHRQLTCPFFDDQPQNPKYDAETALRYAKARLEADTHCRTE